MGFSFAISARPVRPYQKHEHGHHDTRHKAPEGPGEAGTLDHRSIARCHFANVYSSRAAANRELSVTIAAVAMVWTVQRVLS